MVTELTDSRASFDDADTLSLKTKFANDRCLGGKAVWALDLDEKGSPTLWDLVTVQRPRHGGGGIYGLSRFGDLSPGRARQVDEAIKTQYDVSSVCTCLHFHSCRCTCTC